LDVYTFDLIFAVFFLSLYLVFCFDAFKLGCCYILFNF